MTTEKISIKNRHGLRLAIQVDSPDNPKQLVVIEPGQGGTIDQRHIVAFAEAFLENNFRTVRFDPTNSVGDSGGSITDVTYDNYYEDLEDVIAWARNQVWFKQPFALCGHSMGAQATAWYAERHPDEVLLLAPMAPVVNYELYMTTLDPDYKKQWQQQGYVDQASQSKPGVIKRIGWGVTQSLKKYDIMPAAGNLTMPVINIVGNNDRPCPIKHQNILMGAIPSKNKELIIIANAEHSYRNVETGQYGSELDKVKQALSSWLRSINT